jgi:hypothetical protein
LVKDSGLFDPVGDFGREPLRRQYLHVLPKRQNQRLQLVIGDDVDSDFKAVVNRFLFLRGMQRFGGDIRGGSRVELQPDLLNRTDYY